MTDKQQNYLAFMVRIWSGRTKERALWCATLDNAHTGEHRNFTSLDDLYGYLKLQSDTGLDTKEVAHTNQNQIFQTMKGDQKNMNVDEHIRTVERSLEAYNRRDFEAFAGLFKQAATYRSPNLPEPLMGRQQIREHFAHHPESFPDTHVQIERSFGQGNWVCAELTWTATHQGSLPGPDDTMIPPTDKSVHLPIAAIYRFDGEQIAEGREYWDQVAFLTQLGLFP